ncbi:MAG TPA: methylenetetrahydrofolate reductase [Pseudonocardia sp.]|jgi:methylenetetrahydrofolate reductase (NADPH)|uniref:methylenetetrahydrofolate reductase n=1 Tax=Pseudonocardia sp. TaxID=60912 RepID=UPI002B4B35F0|nr:methylenetetrahydrofolate reductase [Pseudonocardia sp.]HLU54056.1 methylenetetrahydrofolate reductase [Pseudonocardia sp.]
MSTETNDAAAGNTGAGTGNRPAAQQPAAAPANRKQALAHALRNASYEILPFKKTEASVLEHVPPDVPLTVTTTEAKGLGPTVDLAVRLTRHGYSAAPHLAARLVRDEAHLTDLLAQLREAGVRNVFVIGGDAAEPAGPFPDALSLLRALDEIGHPFDGVGIGGYPEGHGHIPDDVIAKALEDKAPYATQVITQLCFDAATTVNWARTIKSRGVDLPVRVGIPGAVSRQKLVRITAGIGLGQSARFLKKQQNLLWRFFLPGGYSPNRLVRRLTPSFGGPDTNLAGFHVFTFNELEGTQRWRKQWLARLEGA